MLGEVYHLCERLSDFNVWMSTKPVTVIKPPDIVGIEVVKYKDIWKRL